MLLTLYSLGGLQTFRLVDFGLSQILGEDSSLAESTASIVLPTYPAVAPGCKKTVGVKGALRQDGRQGQQAPRSGTRGFRALEVPKYLP